MPAPKQESNSTNRGGLFQHQKTKEKKHESLKNKVQILKMKNTI